MEKENLIELKNVKKSFDGKNYVISDFNLEVKKGEFVTFLGPSGCGKTTILRMIGGFDKQTSGEILLEGEDIGVLPPNMRPINTVFQKYALFPHLNVYDNVAFGLKLKKLSKEEIDKKVKNVLEIVDLEGFEKRNISTLSGGQQQRIAIARAVINEPKVLLLDEPLSALDYKMRKEMQLELKSMHKKLGITFIFVTHDQEEALTMSDKIVVMANGKIQQIGAPEDIYNEPANVFVADFIGESNIFNGIMQEDKKASFAGAVFQTVDDYPKGIKIDAVIRPEDVEIVEPSKGQIKGTVTSADFKGTFYITFIQCGQYEMEVHCLEMHKVGEEVGLNVAPDNIHIIKYDTSINHYECKAMSVNEDKITVEFADATIDVSPDSIQSGMSITDGKAVVNGSEVSLENIRAVASFDPSKVTLTDDVSAGTVCGVIKSFYYIGDHYSYTVRSDSRQEYYVDDEYLWNQGDRVGIIINSEVIDFELAD